MDQSRQKECIVPCFFTLFNTVGACYPFFPFSPTDSVFSHSLFQLILYRFLSLSGLYQDKNFATPS